MKELELQLELAWKKVTPETCRKIIRQVRAVEDRFWEEDAKLEQNTENHLLEQESVFAFLRLI